MSLTQMSGNISLVVFACVVCTVCRCTLWESGRVQVKWVRIWFEWVHIGRTHSVWVKVWTGWVCIVLIGCHVSSITVGVSWVGSSSSFWVWHRTGQGNSSHDDTSMCCGLKFEPNHLETRIHKYK
uniref:Uncharacterized protein n=1 Tax=Cacopsylla melanoneura TaxID=428564 RepID=A0A8D8VLU8_9HEMI